MLKGLYSYPALFLIILCLIKSLSYCFQLKKNPSDNIVFHVLLRFKNRTTGTRVTSAPSDEETLPLFQWELLGEKGYSPAADDSRCFFFNIGTNLQNVNENIQ